jgi:FtsH-binding integral membrane protein
MTGVSSSFVLLAGLQDLGYLSGKSSTTRFLLATQQLVGALSVWFFFQRQNTYPLEHFYLIPPLLAFPPILILLFGNGRVSLVPHWKNNPYLLWRMTREAISKSKGLAVFLLAAVVALAGVVLDVPFCYVFQNSLLDLLTSGTLVFLGCNLAFWGLFLSLVPVKKTNMDTQQPQQQQQQQQHID